MDLYDLGSVPPLDSQLFYHALADLGREGLLLLSPASPYVCVGYHQDAAREVDLAFCRARGIPVFRREVGGGAVYLDGGQVFFQLVLRREDPRIPASRDAFYRTFLEPVVRVYRRMGIAAEYKPVNDLVVGARKVSGSGVGEIGEGLVFVGNVILDFDYRTMARVLNVPDEKFRDKVFRTLEENLSTVRRELGAERATAWTAERVRGLLAEEFARLVGPLAPREPDDALRDRAEALRPIFQSEAWLLARRGRGRGREIRIRSGLQVLHRLHKAKGGLLRADFELVEGRLHAVSLSGDFFCYPPEGVERLEALLEGAPPAEAVPRIEAFLAAEGVELPGVTAADWAALFAA